MTKTSTTKVMLCALILLAFSIAGTITFIACSEEEQGQNVPNKIVNLPNTISLGRAHNEIMYHFLMNREARNILDFSILNEFNDKTLFGIDMIIDTSAIQSCELYQSLYVNFSYGNFILEVNSKLNAVVNQGQISCEFKDMILSFCNNNNNVKTIIDTLSDYDSKIT